MRSYHRPGGRKRIEGRPVVRESLIARLRKGHHSFGAIARVAADASLMTHLRDGLGQK